MCHICRCPIGTRPPRSECNVPYHGHQIQETVVHGNVSDVCQPHEENHLKPPNNSPAYADCWLGRFVWEEGFRKTPYRITLASSEGRSISLAKPMQFRPCSQNKSHFLRKSGIVIPTYRLSLLNKSFVKDHWSVLCNWEMYAYNFK